MAKDEKIQENLEEKSQTQENSEDNREEKIEQMLKEKLEKEISSKLRSQYYKEIEKLKREKKLVEEELHKLKEDTLKNSDEENATKRRIEELEDKLTKFQVEKEIIEEELERYKKLNEQIKYEAELREYKNKLIAEYGSKGIPLKMLNLIKGSSKEDLERSAKEIEETYLTIKGDIDRDMAKIPAEGQESTVSGLGSLSQLSTDEYFKLREQGKSPDEIAKIFKSKE